MLRSAESRMVRSSHHCIQKRVQQCCLINFQWILLLRKCQCAGTWVKWGALDAQNPSPVVTTFHGYKFVVEWEIWIGRPLSIWLDCDSLLLSWQCVSPENIRFGHHSYLFKTSLPHTRKFRSHFERCWIKEEHLGRLHHVVFLSPNTKYAASSKLW